MGQGFVNFSDLRTAEPSPPTGGFVSFGDLGRPDFTTENAKDAQGNPIVAPQDRPATWNNIIDAGPFGAIGRAINAYGKAGPGQVKEGLKNVWAGNYARGANQVMTGAGVTALPMLAPEIIPAVASAPGAAALTLGAGVAGQQAASRGASALGATPDQADLAGTVASIGTGGARAKLGVPALARWSTNNKAAAMGSAYQQSTRDIQAALGVSADDVHAARPFLEAVHANAVPIVGKEDAAAQLVRAGNLAVSEIEHHVKGLIAQFPNATTPPMQGAILSRVAQMDGASPSDIEAARAVVAKYGLDQPKSLPVADSLRIRLNAENRSVLEGSGVRQRTAIQSDPAFVARQQAADSLREGVYNALEQHGVQGVRDLRRGEGAVIALRNAADPLTRGLRSESTVARTGETSLLRRTAQRVAPMVGAGTGAAISGGNPLVAAAGSEIGNELTSGLTTKNLSRNALMERAFSQRFTSPPQMSVQTMQQPFSSARPSASMGLLPSATLPPGVTAEALPAAPTPQLGPGARPMPPVPDQGGGPGVAARSVVIRDSRTGRMRRIYLSEGKQ